VLQNTLIYDHDYAPCRSVRCTQHSCDWN